MTELAEKSETKPAHRTETERNGYVEHPEDVVEGVLKLLIANGGQSLVTAEQLKEEGLDLDRRTLESWKKTQFPRLYMRLRKDLGREVGEQIAGRALERALEADEAQQKYIEAAVDRLPEVDANHLAKNALALANAKGQDIEKAALLRGQPTERVEVDINASIEVLERLKVVEPARHIEVEAEEIK